MKKFLLLVLFFILFIPNVHAATANISVRNNRSVAVIGQVITTTVTVSSSSNLGSWEFDLKYDSTRLTLTSSSFGGTHIVDVASSGTQKSKSYTFTFIAKKSGTASIYVGSSLVYAFDETRLTVTNGSSSVKIMTQAELEASYSSNNYLKTLEVQNHTITPVFNKSTLEYFLELENGIETVVIKGTVDDSKSSLTGTGEVDLITGDNLFNIVVTAQNGNIRTYKLNISVKELDPILVSINNEEYNLVRKIEDDCPTYFVKQDLEYNDEIVDSCYNESTDFTLVLLKKDTDINYYIYNDDYKLYKELVFNRMIFYYIDKDLKVGKNFIEKEIEINGSFINAYTYKYDNNYSLFYGMNIETGEENIYLYDKLEDTIQRYFDSEIIKKDNIINKYFILLIVLSIISSILVGISVFMLIQSKKIKKNITKIKESRQKS